jgi:hypothetical protein
MKTNALSLILISLITCFASLRPAEAVDPPPDGEYPQGNTAEGYNAFFSLTNGKRNTALGASALFSNKGGDNNTATGFLALNRNTAGNENTATGALALADNALGRQNTATGFLALEHNTNGISNTATGLAALRDNSTGNANTATGRDSLLNNSIGNDNTATGNTALRDNSTGNGNTATGRDSLHNNTTGGLNTASGFEALFHNTTGSFNVALGAGAGSGVITANDVICIGRAVAGVNVNGTCFIGNIRGVTTQNANALPVVIDGAGQLGTASSSQRFKHDIKPMGKASEALLALEPVTFHYKSDSTNIAQFGLIAEEVEKVNPDLVVSDQNGEIYTVRYDAVNAMLLNEFLKEHRKVEVQEATIAQQRKDFEAAIAQQQKQIEALTAGLQKVSAQLEVSKPAPQTVVNNK